MNVLPCTCNPPAVNSSIVGERCHILDEKGEWCAIVNEDGTYLQNLVIPSQAHINAEKEYQDSIAAQQSVTASIEARKQELKEKIVLGQTLSNQELTELLSMIM
jgi:hypothetical protein